MPTTTQPAIIAELAELDACGDIPLALPAHLSTLETLERLVDHPRISDTFRKGLRREITRAHAARREHEGRSGVRWSGMDDDPYRVKTAARIAEEARAAEARMRSPRGLFLTALNGVEQIDPVRGDKLRSLFNRSLADDRQQLNVRAVGAALAILNGVPGRDARAAIDALAELLTASAVAFAAE